MKTILLFSLLFSAAPASAQLSVPTAKWQISKGEDQKRLPYLTVNSLKAAPGGMLYGRPRALLTMLNSSDKPVEGLVLRYAFSVSVSSRGGTAFWALPFKVSETRISRIGPGASHEIRIYQVNLNEQLRRLKGTGFRPNALKLQVMVEPRAGDASGLLMREFEIPFSDAE